MREVRGVLMVAVLLAALAVSAPPAGGQTEGLQSSAECGGLAATIVGTENADVLIGTAGNDVITGLGGNDIIWGLGGRDVLCGGDGRDRLFGGRSADRLYGGDNGDILKGESGADLIFGQKGNDRLIGGNGNDTLNGGRGRLDRLSGRGGTDHCADRQSTTVWSTCESGLPGPPSSPVEVTSCKDNGPLQVATAGWYSNDTLDWVGVIITVDYLDAAGSVVWNDPIIFLHSVPPLSRVRWVSEDLRRELFSSCTARIDSTFDGKSNLLFDVTRSSCKSVRGSSNKFEASGTVTNRSDDTADVSVITFVFDEDFEPIAELVDRISDLEPGETRTWSDSKLLFSDSGGLLDRGASCRSRVEVR